jgi:hypothetical protein
VVHLAGSQEVKQASKLPLFVALGLIALGSACIPLATVFGSNIFFVVGYLITPVMVFLTVAWDSLAQRAGSRDAWFAVNKKLSTMVRAVALLSLVPGVAHIWYISIWVGEIAVQQGWFS